MIRPFTKTLADGWLKDTFILALAIAIIYSILLSSRPLSVPDEARYAEIPREMVVTHNYITPHLNYVKYFEKPALFYWLQAGAIKLWGDNELAVRMPNALMALFGCLLTYGIGRLIYNRRTGIIASLILASSALYFVMGHLVTIDMTLSTFLTASLFCWLLGIRTKQSLAYYGFYAFAALAVLTKGLIGLIFPAMIIGSWILILNEWQLLKRIYLPSGILIFLAIAAPWHLLVQWYNPEFLRFYLLDQQFLRYFTHSANRSQPPGFFIPVLLLGFLPWAIFIVQAYCYNLPKWQDRKQNKFTLFLLLWPTLIFLFFSLSHSQLIPYLLPIFPPLAILIGRYLSDQWDLKTPFPGTRWGYAAIPLLIFFAAVGGLIVNHIHKLLVLSTIKREILALSLIWLCSSLLATFFIWHKRAIAAFSAILIGSLLVYFLVLIAMPKADTRSIKTLALTIKPHMQPGDEVVTYQNYYQDLPFYLKRRIIIVDWQNELEFGMHHQDTSSWMIPQATFWQLWQSNKKVYMLTDNDTYASLKQSGQYKLYLLAQTPGDVLLVNHQNL